MSQEILDTIYNTIKEHLASTGAEYGLALEATSKHPTLSDVSPASGVVTCYFKFVELHGKDVPVGEDASIIAITMPRPDRALLDVEATMLNSDTAMEDKWVGINFSTIPPTSSKGGDFSLAEIPKFTGEIIEEMLNRQRISSALTSAANSSNLTPTSDRLR